MAKSEMIDMGYYEDYGETVSSSDSSKGKKKKY